MKKLIVTRYLCLAEYLKKNGIVEGDVDVMTRVTCDDVKDRHVIGVLPYYLAAKTAKFTEVQMRVPEELRGHELRQDQVEFYLQPIKTYRIEEVEQ